MDVSDNELLLRRDPDRAEFDIDEPGYDGEHRSRLWRIYAVTWRWAVILIALIVLLLFAGNANYLDSEQAQGCLGILLAISLLWVTEAIPVYATALLVPLLGVLLGVVTKGVCEFDGERGAFDISCQQDSDCREIQETVMAANEKNDTLAMEADDYVNATCIHVTSTSVATAKILSGAFFKPVVLLFLGTFVMSRVIQKRGLDLKLAALLLGDTPRKPATVTLVIMILGWGLSMIVTNVGGAIAAVGVTVPILNAVYSSLAPGDTLPRAMLVAVAFACDLGGQPTPIASPQNLITSDVTNHIGAELAGPNSTNAEHGISFAVWMFVAVPTSLVGVMSVWVLVWWYFKPSDTLLHLGDASMGRDGGSARSSQRKNLKGPPAWHERNPQAGDAVVLLTTGAVVLLWCLSSIPVVHDYFGDIGVTGVIPIAVFFGTGLLDEEDFVKGLSWPVVVLIGGGLCLGTAISESGLLRIMSEGMGNALPNNVYVSSLGFSTLVWIMANFVSHTAAAAIAIPVVASAGVANGHYRLMSMTAVMTDSAAMALPISGFPNTLAFAQMNPYGERFLSVQDFFFLGVPLGALQVVIVNSMGFALAYVAGL
eukprot:Clim_evm46s151 gene=Clim_evmTU46s151